MGVVVPNNARHQLLALICAFIIGLAHSFVPNKVLRSSPLWSSSHPQQIGGRAKVNDHWLVRFASSLPNEEQLTTPEVTFTESPEFLFQQLAVVGDTNKSNNNDDSSFLVVGMEELKQWGELQDLLSDEEITSTELEDMFAEAITKGKNNNDDKLDKDGFVLLYKSIDNLFVYEDQSTADEGEITNVGGNDIIAAVGEVTSTESGSEDQKSLPNNKQDELLSFLSGIHSVSDDEKLPCGMDCTDKEREVIAKLVSDLEAEPNNLVLKQNGKIGTKDLIGNWDLLYTNSKGIIMNKSLSGLGSSDSKKNTFSSVRQRLTGSK